MTITKPGATYVKVHFAHFNIPASAHMVIQSPDEREKYTYTKDNLEDTTVDIDVGDDGITSFSAMSIEGDTAIVTLEVPRNIGDELPENYLEVDSFYAGRPFDMSQDREPVDDDLSIYSTCGLNERRDIECAREKYPVAYERTRPVARLLMGAGSCTAWRLSESNRLMTNHHCISSNFRVRRSEIQFNYHRKGCQEGDTTIPIKVAGKRLLTSSGNFDYALFEVKNFDRIKQFGHFGINPRAVVENERIYIPQHGAGHPKQLSIESEEDRGSFCRIAKDKDVNKRSADFGYNCDTTGGSSGSPILSFDDHLVIGLHHLGGCLNSGTTINDIWPKIKHFFPNGLPRGDNKRSLPSTKSPSDSTTQRPTFENIPLVILDGNCTIVQNWNGIHCVTSPNYPNHYNSVEKCIVEIKAKGFIYTESFDTEDTWDELVIRRMRYSGITGPKNVKVFPKMKIFWRSDYDNQYPGWKICHRIKKY